MGQKNDNDDDDDVVLPLMYFAISHH